MSAPTIVHGPAQVEYGGLKFITTDDIVLTENPEGFEIATDAHGYIEDRLKSRSATVTFTPSGQWTGEAVTLISAASGRVPGASILSGPLVIKPLISPQKVITLGRAGLTSLPPVNLSASKTLFGSLTFTGIAAADSETGAPFIESSYSAPTSTFDPSLIITEPWTGTWATTMTPDLEEEIGALADIETEDGWTLSAEITTQNFMSDSYGITDIAQIGCKVTVRCKPVGVSESDLIAALTRNQPEIALRTGESFGGRDFETGGIQNRSLFLNSRSGTYRITLAYCGLRSGGLTYGAKSNRTSELVFTAIRKFTTGAAQPMLAFEVIGG